MLDEPIQMETTITCGPFQLHFYENLFFPNENSKLHSYKKINKRSLRNNNQRTFYAGLKN